MNIFKDWTDRIEYKTAQLFETDGMVVTTFDKNYRSGKIMRKLKRHVNFDSLVINTVENGLKNENWEGFVYLMHFGMNMERPLYVGKAEKKGVSNEISFNLKNIRSNDHAFARWGYGLAYHIGDLSHAIYQEDAYKKPSKNYKKWASVIFKQVNPPTLKEQVYVTIFSWEKGMIGPSSLIGSVPSVEKELIALLGAGDNSILLNVDGR